MGKTIRGEKGPGYDYWGRRYDNESGCNSPSKRNCRLSTKKLTNRAERRKEKQNFKSKGTEYEV